MNIRRTIACLALLAWLPFSAPAYAANKYYFYVVVSFPGSGHPNARGILHNKKDPFDKLSECKKALLVARNAARKSHLKIESIECRKK